MDKIKNFTTKVISITLTLLLLTIAQCFNGVSVNAATSKTIVVAKDGSGNYRTVQAAVNSIPRNNNRRVTIYIKNGTYKEKVRITQNMVSLKGQSRNGVTITYNDHINEKKSSQYNEETPTVKISGNNFYSENINYVNTAGQIERANALQITSDRNSFFNCKIIGGQDTLFLRGKGTRAYFENCYIEGDVDFIYGSMTAVFEKCEINSNDGGYVTAPSTDQKQKFGFMFDQCRFTGRAKRGSVALGRPWRAYASTVLKNCQLGAHISPEGWNNWGNKANEKTARFMEYNSRGAGWNRSKRVRWAKILDNNTVRPYTTDNYLRGSDRWNYKQRF